MPATAAAGARRLRRPEWVDVALAAALTMAFVGVAWKLDPEKTSRDFDLGGLAITIVAGGSLAWRRVAPEAVVVVSTAAITLYALFDYPGGPVYLSPMIAIYTLASLDGRRRALPVAIGSILVAMGAGLLHNTGPASFLAHLLFASWSVVALFLGEATRNRHAHLAFLEERTRTLEASQHEEARRQVAEERLRIARDLHDSVAHHLASISIQAAAGQRVITSRPDQAADALAAIREASGRALDELRGTLAMLREQGERAPTSPAHEVTLGLDQIDGLVRTATSAGIDVEVRARGPLRQLPEAVDTTAYRIVQESLTNVMRHAQAGQAAVTLVYGDDSLEIAVRDDGTGGNSNGITVSTTTGGDHSGGHGLAGMRERAELLGGSFEAGPCDDGGFAVHAVLPVTSEDDVDVRRSANRANS